MKKPFATIYNNIHCCIHLKDEITKSNLKVTNQACTFSGNLNRLKSVLEVRKLSKIPILDISNMSVKDIMNKRYHLGKRVN